MKLNLIVVSLTTTVGLLATAASASTGIIHFNGELTDVTCKVDIEGQGANPTITLPTVPVSVLTTAGEVAGNTAFNLNLSDCALGSSGKTKVSAFFETGVTVDQSTGRLKNTLTDSTAATNVQLQILDANSTAIKLGNTTQVTENPYVTIAADNTATIPYSVEYYALGQTTAGKVASNVVYTLQYK